jgi:hypothetical protein
MTYSSYLIIQHVHETIKYIFILTHKNLLHLCNEQIKPTHLDTKHIGTQEFNVVHPKLGYIHNEWFLILLIHV